MRAKLAYWWFQSPPKWIVPYLASDASKKSGEWFFLWYSVVWIAVVAAMLLSEVYKNAGDVGFGIIGLVTYIPCLGIPIWYPGVDEMHLKWYRRYTTKANLWVAIFGFIANYFWTHYFYELLGAKYTFPIKYMINEVPPVCFLLTQSYFQTYYVISNILMRAVYRKCIHTRLNWLVNFLIQYFCVFLMAVSFAFLETWTIQSVPYYSFVDRNAMYKRGIFFYSLYFIVSIPMFFKIDEIGQSKKHWSLSKTVKSSLASAMTVFILCDFWRLSIGSIVETK